MVQWVGYLLLYMADPGSIPSTVYDSLSPTGLNPKCKSRSESQAPLCTAPLKKEKHREGY